MWPCSRSELLSSLSVFRLRLTGLMPSAGLALRIPGFTDVASPVMLPVFHSSWRISLSSPCSVCSSFFEGVLWGFQCIGLFPSGGSDIWERWEPCRSYLCLGVSNEALSRRVRVQPSKSRGASMASARMESSECASCPVSQSSRNVYMC